MTIGVMTDVPGSGRKVDSACVEAVESTMRSLELLGHQIVDDRPAALSDPIIDPLMDVFAVGLAREVARWSHHLGRDLAAEDLEDATWAQADRGRSIPGIRWLELTEQLAVYGRRVASWWESRDLLITPTMAAPTPELATDGFVPDADKPTMEFTVPFNVTGQPAISLPLGRTEDGLPIGVHLVAAMGREDLLLSIASQLEEAAPWVTMPLPVL